MQEILHTPLHQGRYWRLSGPLGVPCHRSPPREPISTSLHGRQWQQSLRRHARQRQHPPISRHWSSAPTSAQSQLLANKRRATPSMDDTISSHKKRRCFGYLPSSTRRPDHTTTYTEALSSSNSSTHSAVEQSLMAAVRALLDTANAVYSRLADPRAPTADAHSATSPISLAPLHSSTSFSGCRALSDHSYSSHQYSSALSQASPSGASEEVGGRAVGALAPSGADEAAVAVRARARTPSEPVFAPKISRPAPLLPTPLAALPVPAVAAPLASPMPTAHATSPSLLSSALPTAPASNAPRVPSLMSLSIPPPSSLHFICSRLYR